MTLQRAHSNCRAATAVRRLKTTRGREPTAGAVVVALLLCASLTTVSTRQVYEDVLRTLLGSNAYILFTLHKIISQAKTG